MRRKTERIQLTREEKEFLTELYQQHSRVAFRAALSLSRNPEVAGDLVQECFIGLMKNISTVRSLECCKVDAYIVTAIRRLCINYAVKESKRALLPIEQPSVAVRVDDLITRKTEEEAELHLTLTSLLEQLSERDRRILESYYIEGLPDEALAAEFRCNPNSIRMLRSRACSRAKAIGLKSEEGDENENR